MIVLHRSKEHLKKRSRALAVERELPCRIDKVAASEEGQARRVEELERALDLSARICECHLETRSTRLFNIDFTE